MKVIDEILVIFDLWSNDFIFRRISSGSVSFSTLVSREELIETVFPSRAQEDFDQSSNIRDEQLLHFSFFKWNIGGDLNSDWILKDGKCVD